MNNPITISTLVHSDLDTVWEAYTEPEHIKKWNFTNNTWCCPRSQSILKVWWRFTHTMSSRDGEMQFDFEGTYTRIIENELLAYMLDDERNVEIHFDDQWTLVEVTVNFEAEAENDRDAQKKWWESILSNFAWYAEGL